LGFQLAIFEADQKIASPNAVVELDEDLFDGSRHRCGDAQFAPFRLNAPWRCSRPEGFDGYRRLRMCRRRAKGKQSGRAAHADAECQDAKDKHERIGPDLTHEHVASVCWCFWRSRSPAPGISQYYLALVRSFWGYRSDRPRSRSRDPRRG